MSSSAIEENPLVAVRDAWTRTEQVIFLAAGVAVSVLAYAYCFHMYRAIPFDEIGLHNPIYMYATTGKISYPMHGQYDFMTVHPPTHYILTALLMKLNLSLFNSAAAPIFALTVLTVILLLFGGFSFGSALALMLAAFLGTYIWGEFYTIRPDLIVTYLWFDGLIAFQAARNCNWSPWRLFLGSALTVAAPCMHYWGIAALAGIPVFCIALLRDRAWKFSNVVTPFSAVAAGGLLVGLPFLILFVIPLYPQIMEMVHGDQTKYGVSGPVEAFQRHLQSYASLAPRIQLNSWVRWLTSVLTAPILRWRIPAILIGVPVLALWREMRLFAIAAVPLPLFVLFFSDALQVGYTGYLMPEMVLYFAGILLLLINVPAYFLSEATRPLGRMAVATTFVILSLVEVPTSMGNDFDWTQNLDLLEVSRGAAITIVGRNAVVGGTSAGTWYTSGGRYIWNAFNDLINANRSKVNIRHYLKPIDALAVDENWWNAAPEYAPVSSWYLERLLSLKGFVLPTTDRTMDNLLIFVSANEGPIAGYFIDKEKVSKFVQDKNGQTTFAVLSCPQRPEISALKGAFYKKSFSYMSQPSNSAPQILLLAAQGDFDLPRAVADKWDCRLRDSVQGTLVDVSRDELKKLGSADARAPMKFYQTRDQALAAAGRPTGEANAQ